MVVIIYWPSNPRCEIIYTGMVWYGMVLQAGESYRHDHVIEAMYTAVANLIDKGDGMRKSVDKELLGGEPATGSTWLEHSREHMHAIVDEMHDNTDFATKIQTLMVQTKQMHTAAVHYAKVAESAAARAAAAVAAAQNYADRPAQDRHPADEL